MIRTAAGRAVRRPTGFSGVVFAVAAAAVLLAACEDGTEPLGPSAGARPAHRPEFAVIVHEIMQLPTLGGRENRAYGINDLGQIVGWSQNADGLLRAYRWENGALTDLGTQAGASGSTAASIDARGRIAGASPTGDGDGRAFFWQNGTMHDLGTLGGAGSYANGQNDNGQVVGLSFAADGTRRDFLWENGAMRDLGALGGSDYTEAFDINNRGQVVGRSNNRAFLWENGVMRELPALSGSGNTRAFAINERGDVAGLSATAAGEVHAVLWQDGELYDLGTTGGDFSIAQSINNHGEVVGYARNAAGEDVAIRWVVPIRAEVAVAGNGKKSAGGAIPLRGGPDKLEVVVYGSPWFDVVFLDAATITLGNDDGNETPVSRKKNGDVLASVRDVDGDGSRDLVLEFSKQAMVAKGDLSAATTKLVLLGSRVDGRKIRGTAQVQVDP